MPWQRISRMGADGRVPVVSITPRGDVYLNRPAISLAEKHMGSLIRRQMSILVNADSGIALITPDDRGWILSPRKSGSAVLSRAMKRKVPNIVPGLYLLSVVYVADLLSLGKVIAFAFTVSGESTLAQTLEDAISGEPMTISV